VAFLRAQDEKLFWGTVFWQMMNKIGKMYTNLSFKFKLNLLKLTGIFLPNAVRWQLFGEIKP